MSKPTTHDICIGDNLDILPTLDGPFDLIYLDPPYNTGGRAVTAYDDARQDWTGFLRERVAQLPRPPAETGVVIASIADRDAPHLPIPLDELLGTEDFVGTVVWDGSTINSAHLLSVSHDYLGIYAADLAALQASGVRWRQDRPDAEAALDAAGSAWRDAGGDRAEAQKRFRSWLAPRRSILPRGLTEYDRIDEHGLLYRV